MIRQLRTTQATRVQLVFFSHLEAFLHQANNVPTTPCVILAGYLVVVEVDFPNNLNDHTDYLLRLETGILLPLIFKNGEPATGHSSGLRISVHGYSETEPIGPPPPSSPGTTLQQAHQASRSHSAPPTSPSPLKTEESMDMSKDRDPLRTFLVGSFTVLDPVGANQVDPNLTTSPWRTSASGDSRTSSTSHHNVATGQPPSRRLRNVARKRNMPPPSSSVSLGGKTSSYVPKPNTQKLLADDMSTVIFITDLCGQGGGPATSVEDLQALLFNTTQISLASYISACSLGKGTFSAQNTLILGPFKLPCTGVDRFGIPWSVFTCGQVRGNRKRKKST